MTQIHVAKWQWHWKTRVNEKATHHTHGIRVAVGGVYGRTVTNQVCFDRCRVSNTSRQCSNRRRGLLLEGSTVSLQLTQFLVVVAVAVWGMRWLRSLMWLCWNFSSLATKTPVTSWYVDPLWQNGISTLCDIMVRWPFVTEWHIDPLWQNGISTLCDIMVRWPFVTEWHIDPLWHHGMLTLCQLHWLYRLSCDYDNTGRWYYIYIW